MKPTPKKIKRLKGLKKAKNVWHNNIPVAKSFGLPAPTVSRKIQTKKKSV